MGCIVNGPGEMADADYGYVGAGRGKISLYKGKVCVEKNIPEEEAVERLLGVYPDRSGRKPTMIIGHGIQVMGTDLIENLSSVPNYVLHIFQ